MARDRYAAQVELLVRAIPIVAEEREFALKGGTAINLFYRDMPRLSVDIDLTYVPLDDRVTADNSALRQAYTRLLIDEVTVESDRVQIRGSRRALGRAVVATAARGGATVPSFAREWRTRQDSNLWPLPSEGNALSS